VARFDGSRWQRYSVAAGGLLSDYVTSIAAGPDGAVWFGAWGGVSRFDGSRWISYTTADGLVAMWVTALAVQPDGTAWFGTNGSGVSCFYGFRQSPTLVAGGDPAPAEFALLGNYPNPFNASTAIEFSLVRPVDVQLTIYAITGQEVRTLLAGPRAAGSHTLRWDGRDGRGRQVASGVYLVDLRAERWRAAHRMTLLR
jgi:hypothetical protein